MQVYAAATNIFITPMQCIGKAETCLYHHWSYKYPPESAYAHFSLYCSMQSSTSLRAKWALLEFRNLRSTNDVFPRSPTLGVKDKWSNVVNYCCMSYTRHHDKSFHRKTSCRVGNIWDIKTTLLYSPTSKPNCIPLSPLLTKLMYLFIILIISLVQCLKCASAEK